MSGADTSDRSAAAPRPDWDAVRRLFEEVQARPPAARDAFLAGAEVPDAVRAEAASLLAHDPSEAFLADARPPAVPPGRGLRDGERCGAWQLVRLIGRGGMGEVYEARRVDGAFDGTAAVKLLRPGLDSVLVLRRFAAERQVLARLTHPHIARLLDAGLTADGRPYFVMEHVEGRPLDEAGADLPVAARLRLFLQLANAVAHAHRHLLVHRDLKPGNVLVDRDGQVKLLDFGIAKALDPLDPAAAEPGAGDLTQAGDRPYTPHYASPEQVRGEPVGTATDVYSLGVLLYVLLTGQRPYGRDTTTAQAAARAVVEDPPTRPSLLRPDLRGDLDNILRKALDKEPERRYASVDALADDLRAHLDGRPVSARRQSTTYLLGRFVARNRVASAVGATGLMALVAGLVLALWQVQALEQAQARAERRFAQVRQLAQGIVFRYHDQIVHLPGSIPVRESLLADASRYLDGLLAEGTPDPGLAREVAETYQRIAVLQGEQFSPSQERLAEAASNLDKALALLPRYVDEPDVPVSALHHAADMWMARSTLHTRAAALQPGWRALESARVLVERAVLRAPDDLETVSRLATLEGRIGMLLGSSAANANLGRVAEGVAMVERAERRMAGLAQRDPGQVEWTHQWAWACQMLSRAYVLVGRSDPAIAWGEKSVQLRDRALTMQPGNTHFRHQTATARMTLSGAASVAGQHARALALHAEAEDIMRSLLRDDPGNKAAERDTRLLSFIRAQLLVRAGQHAQARGLLDRALADLGAPTAAGDDFYLDRIRADTLLWLARAWQPEDPTRAEALARQSAEAMQPADVDDNAARWWAYALARGEQAQALAGRGQTVAAGLLARDALQAWRRAMPSSEAATAGGVPAAVPGYFRSAYDRDLRLARTGPVATAGTAGTPGTTGTTGTPGAAP